ncbi:MAG: metallophosphoesterase, partial [Chitinophagaceae bacterium]
MLVSFLHLSDIHFKENKNVISNRKEKIFNTIKNELKGKDRTFIITSGDVAFSGKNEEYSHANEFYKYLYKEIKSYNGTESGLIFVPGNHDCDFDDSDQEIRKIILRSFSENGLTSISEKLIEVCCAPQNNFFEFQKSIEEKISYNGDTVFEHPLLKIKTYKLGDFVIKLSLFNSSWDSQLKEEMGKLKFPIDYLYDQIPTIENSLSISIVHHPFNWQSPENSRQFRKALLETSDIIISGHEHDGRLSILSDFGNQFDTLHVESPALQDSNNERTSSFNLINLNTDPLEVQVQSYTYNGDTAIYDLKTDTGWKGINKQKKFKSRDFQIKKEFLADIENPGASFTHRNVDNFKLADIYTPPIFNNISIDKEKKSRFQNYLHSDSALEMPEQIDDTFYKLVLGPEVSGKTALLRYFYLKYYEKGYYPIYLSGDKISDVSEDKIKQLVKRTLSKQYDELEGKFSEIDYRKIVLLIDDFHKYKIKKGKVALVKNITKLFKRVIISGSELMLFETYVTKENKKVEVFESFDQYIIQEFSPTLRNQLINKWYRLGKEYMDIDERNGFFRNIDLASSNITTIIGKNLIPAYPVYILTILQAFESGESDSTDNKLHAYYYEMLITKSLRKALPDKDDIGFYMTFCKEYFFFLFNEQIRFNPIAKDGFIRFVEFHA